MSRYLAPFFDDEEFVTALLVDATDPARLTLVSCGHPQALMVNGNASASLIDAPAGLPLGLGDKYDDLTMAWEPGDRLLMYTDGLSEARDADGEFLAVPSLAPLLRNETVDDALEEALEAVQRHIPSGDLSDDLAVMLLENVAVSLPEAADHGLLGQTRYEKSAPR
jgi:serine phosphatase RsbU (regulator of sigma subunit)